MISPIRKIISLKEKASNSKELEAIRIIIGSFSTRKAIGSPFDPAYSDFL